MMINRLWLALAGASGAAAVAVEAMVRHGTGLDPHRAELAAIAARYALLHAPALLAVGVFAGGMAAGWGRRCVAAAGWCFAAGLVLFSGTLYWLALDLPAVVAPLTPLGGVAFIAGWAMLLLAALLPRGRP